MQILARNPAAGKDTALEPIAIEDALRSGDQVQIRINVTQDAYVYVIAYTSSGSASLLFPESGDAEDALVRANGERVVPGPDSYLTLGDRAGLESFYAVASAAPLGPLATLLVHMEAAGDDHGAVTASVRERFPELAAVTLHHLSAQRQSTEVNAQAPGRPAAVASVKPPMNDRATTDPQLDVEAMECLYAWLSGGDPGGTSISPEATLEVAPRQGATGASGGCALGAAALAHAGGTESKTATEPVAAAPPLPPTAGGSGAGGAETLPAASAPSGMENGIPIAAAEAPPIAEADPGPGLSAGAAAEALIDIARAPSLAPPVGDLLVALSAPPSDPTAPVRSIDVTSDGNVSSAVVLVVTPATTGTGVLLDYAGHILANWHVVRGYPSVSITFKSSDGASPSAARTYSARVVRLSKTADLALLRIDNPPKGVMPVRIAKTNEIRNGDIVHAVGHPQSGNWAYSPGKIDQVKPGSSWYAGHNLLHRGTVIFAELPENSGSAGAPLFNNSLELVGIGAAPRSSRGVLTGISTETIRQFLQAPPAEARASMGG